MLYETKITCMSTSSTAGTTSICSTDMNATLGVLDMAGFESIAFLSQWDFASGAVCKINLRCADTSGTLFDCNLTTGWAGSSGTTAAFTGRPVLLDVYRPAHRYVGYGVVRGTAAATLQSMIAVQYNGEWSPPPTTGMLIGTQVTGGAWIASPTSS
jgi:hypothetical protein